MKKRFIIKTVDGNRYETDEVPTLDRRFCLDFLRFPSRDGKGVVYVNTDTIVCFFEREVEE